MCTKLGSGDVDFQDSRWRSSASFSAPKGGGNGIVNPYANKAYKPKGNAWWDQRLNEGLFGQTYRGPAARRGSRGSGQQRNPYAGLIENMLNQSRADSRAESVADAAQRDANIKRILISLGEAPTWRAVR